MLAILLFYGTSLALIVSLSIWLFRFLRRWGLVYALAGSAMLLCLSGLLWPIPIHGGFMLLGEGLYDEWSRERDAEKQASQQLAAIRQMRKPRFAGVLPVRRGRQLAAGWVAVVDELGNDLVLDTESGLIWSDWLMLNSSVQRPTLVDAKEHCANRSPAGYWALATMAEAALAWQAGADQVMADAQTSWISYSTDNRFDFEFPSIHLRSPASNQLPDRSREEFSLRCVARSATAPPWGFTRDDIDLELWNTFQLNLLQ